MVVKLLLLKTKYKYFDTPLFLGTKFHYVS